MQQGGRRILESRGASILLAGEQGVPSCTCELPCQGTCLASHPPGVGRRPPAHLTAHPPPLVAATRLTRADTAAYMWDGARWAGWWGLPPKCPPGSALNRGKRVFSACVFDGMLGAMHAASSAVWVMSAYAAWVMSAYALLAANSCNKLCNGNLSLSPQNGHPAHPPATC